MGGGGAAGRLSFPAAIRVYLCTVPGDLRRSFDGLSMMAEQILGCHPFSGHLLVFSKRRTDRLKILYWDRDGWAIWYKRREAGTFQFPLAETGRREIAEYNVCGTPRCRCEHPKDLRKHGLYYQLSYTWRGHSRTRFLRPEQVDQMHQKVAHYKRFRELVNQWVDLAVELEQAERAQAKHSHGD